MLKISLLPFFLKTPVLKLALLPFVFLLLITPAFAQKKFTISGTIKDEASGELLIGASVILKSTTTQSATISNAYGFYSLSVAEGDYILAHSYTGYEAVSRVISLHKDEVVNISLVSKNNL